MGDLRVVSADELRVICEKHKIWRNRDLVGAQADLRGMDLREVNFEGLDLSHAQFAGADLTGAILSGANLAGADLSDTNLNRAKLQEATLVHATLANASLIGASLYQAKLAGAQFHGANLHRARLHFANAYEADFAGADLSDAEFCGANLFGVNLQRANLTNTNFIDANLIVAGPDVRGFLFYAYHSPGLPLRIRAGCRNFLGMTEAVDHWTHRHGEHKILHADCLSLVGRIGYMASQRGWMLEVYELGGSGGPWFRGDRYMRDLFSVPSAEARMRDFERSLLHRARPNEASAPGPGPRVIFEDRGATPT